MVGQWAGQSDLLAQAAAIRRKEMDGSTSYKQLNGA
jgi:hypothetical protein